MSCRQPACHKYTRMGSEPYNQLHVAGYSLKVGSWVYGQQTAFFLITDECTLPASQSLPRGSILSQFNSVHTRMQFFLTLIPTIPTIYLDIGFISHFFS